MCKVLIKRVLKVHEPKIGNKKDGQPWALHMFDCEVDVDNSGKTAARLIKTFDAKMAKKIEKGAGETFEAKRQGEEKPYSYMIETPRKAFGGVAQKSNRQVAVECASRLGTVNVGNLLRNADLIFQWLESGKTADEVAGIGS